MLTDSTIPRLYVQQEKFDHFHDGINLQLTTGHKRVSDKVSEDSGFL